MVDLATILLLHKESYKLNRYYLFDKALTAFALRNDSVLKDILSVNSFLQIFKIYLLSKTHFNAKN